MKKQTLSEEFKRINSPKITIKEDISVKQYLNNAFEVYLEGGVFSCIYMKGDDEEYKDDWKFNRDDYNDSRRLWKSYKSEHNIYISFISDFE
jgi:hypothetical protein